MIILRIIITFLLNLKRWRKKMKQLTINGVLFNFYDNTSDEYETALPINQTDGSMEKVKDAMQ
ncbi:hypothetical protein FACS1894110_24690 [Spirochaetia bacterium]|nr:hypothetical protein FACS1894110_24690 [Spirochaetia bacterium]